MNQDSNNNQKIDTSLTSIADRQLSYAAKEYKDALQGITQQQQNALDAYTRRRIDREVSPEALVSDTGMETVGGRVVNTGLTMADAASQFVGGLVSLPQSSAADFSAQGLTSEDLNMYKSILDVNKQAEEAGKEPEYTEAQKAFMSDSTSTKTASSSSSIYAQNKAYTPNIGGFDEKVENKMRQVERVISNQSGAKTTSDFFKFLEPYVNKVKQEGLQEDLGNVFDTNVGESLIGFEKLRNGDLSGIDDLVKSISKMGAEGAYQMLTNPYATAETFAASIPDMIAAVRRAPIAAASLGNRNFLEALDKFEKEYGDIPVGDQRTKARALTTLAGLVGSYSDKFIAQGAALTIPNKVRSLTPRVVAGAVTEGIAETTETALTQYAGVQDVSKMDGKELYVAGVLGAGMGAGVAGAVSTVQRSKQVGGILATKAGAKEVSKQAIYEGTIHTSEEVSGGLRDIDDAVKEEVFNKVDMSTANGLSAALRNATKIIDSSTATVEAKEDASLVAKYGLNMVKNRIDNAKEIVEQIKEYKKEPNQDEKAVNQLNAIEKETLNELKRLEKVLTNYEQKVNNEFTNLINSEEKISAIKSRLNSPDVELESLANRTEEETESLNRQANKDASLLVSASLESELVTDSDLIQASKSPNITPQKAIQLEKTAELNNLLKTTSDVSNDIINGGQGYVGVRQYQQRITDMLNTGSVQAAVKELGKLNNFASHMNKKAQDVTEAYNDVLNGVEERVELDDYKNLESGAPLVISPASRKLVPTIQNEAKLVDQAFTNLKEQVQAFAEPVQSKEIEVASETVNESSKETEINDTAETTTNEDGESNNTVDKNTESEAVSENTNETSNEVIPETNTEAEVTNESEVVDSNSETEVETNKVLESLNEGVVDTENSFLSGNPVKKYLTPKRRGVVFNTGINAEALSTELGRELRVSEKTMLEQAPKFISKFSEAFTKLVPSADKILGRRKYQARNVLDSFTQEDGTYSKEFVNAVALSSYEFLENNTASLLGGDYSSMANILGVDTKDFVPTQAQLKLLENVGSPYGSVAARLGAVVMKNLGLTKNPNSPQNVNNNIEFGLGKAALSVLAELGIADIQSYKASEKAALKSDTVINEDSQGNTETINNTEYSEIYSVSIKPEGIDSVLGLRTSAEKGAVSLQMFGMTDGFIESITSVSKEPRKAVIGTTPPKVSNSVKSSGGLTASIEFDKGANKEAAIPHRIDKNMHTVFETLGDDWFAEMLGKKSEESVIAGLVPKVKGTNQTIDRDINNYKKFVERMLDTSGNLDSTFFYNYEFGKNFRLFAKSADINFQSSMLHRYLTSIPASKVDPRAEDNSSYITFKLAVAQGLGVSIDKNTLSHNLEEFNSLVSNPKIVNAVDALVKVVQGEAITDLDKAAIMDGVKEGGEKTHSLKSLMSLAELKLANGQPFETTVTYEIDGVTNGPFNAHVQLGMEVEDGKLTPLSLKRLNQGGVLTDGTNSYADWISNPSNWDMYQTTAMTVDFYEKSLFEEWYKDKNKNLQNIKKYSILKKYVGEIVEVTEDGTKVTSAGRKLTKNPITVTVYASGKRSISDKAAKAIRENILEEIQKAFEAKDTNKIKQIGNDITALGFTLGKGVKGFTFDESFQKGKTKQFDNFVNNTLGKAINNAITEDFSTQKRNTDLITETSNTVFHIFMPIYNQKVSDKLKELREKGELSKYEYLSENQLKEIQKDLIKTMPVFKGFYGTEQNGIMTGGFNPINPVPDQFKPMFRVDVSLGHKGYGESYTNGFTAPEASPMAMLNIANGDATTMVRSASKADSDIGLNVFDARLVSVDNVLKSSTLLNQSAYEAVTDYSITEAVKERLLDSIAIFNQVELDINNPDLLPLKHTVLASLSEDTFIMNGKATQFKDGKKLVASDKEVNEMITRELIDNYLKSLTNKVVAMDVASKEAKQILKKDLYFNQFEALGTGVRYNKGKMIQGAQLSTEGLVNGITKAESTLIENLNSLPEGDIDQALADSESRINQTKDNGFTSPEAEAGMVYFFDTKEVFDISEVSEFIDTAVRVTKDNAATVAVISKLVDTLTKRGIKIQINKGTNHSNIITSEGVLNSRDVRGYYDALNKTIVLNGKDQVNTGMTQETLFHEIVHAAVNDALFAYKSGDTSALTQKQLQAAKRIDALYNNALKDNSLDSVALENIYEFAAWGITNKRTANVLQNVATKVRKLVNDIVNTIRTLVGLEQSENNAYLDLVDSVTSLASGTKVLSSIDNKTPSTPQKVHDNIKVMKLVEVFDGLSNSNNINMSREHRAHLREVLDKAVQNAIDPSLIRTKDANENMSLEDALLLERLDPSITQNRLSLALQGFKMTKQESFVFGMYSQVIDSALNDFGWNTKEIRRMYDYAAKELSWKDFVDDRSVLNTPQDMADAKAEAQARYDAIFNVSKAGNYDYLRNFMALAETNENFRERLAELATPKATELTWKGDNFRDTVSLITNNILNWFNDLVITKSNDPIVLAKLDKLAKNIRHKEKLEKVGLMKEVMKVAGFASNTLNRINNWSKQLADKTLDSAKAKYKDRVLLNAAINLSGLVLSKKRAEAFATGLDTLQNYTSRGRESLISSIWSEMKGANSSNVRVHNLLAIKNKMIDQENVQIQRNIARMVLDSFGTPLNDKSKLALTKAVLKTDLSTLLENGYDYDSLKELLKSDTKVQSEISKVKSQLRQKVSPDLYNYFTNRAKALGRYMTKGEVTQDGMVFNADAIVSLLGTGRTDPKVSKQVRDMVDVLATLEATNIVPLWQRSEVAALMESEGLRTDGNGVNFIMQLHLQNKKAALTKNFKGTEFNYQKGYTKEILDPYKSIKIAPASAEKELAMQGYTKSDKELIRDSLDPIQKGMYMYVSEHGGQATYLQGILSTADMAAKGFDISDSYTQAGSMLVANQKAEVIKEITSQKNNSIDSLFTNKPNNVMNPLVPTYNKAGEVKNYRYMMNESTKDTLLSKDNRVEHVLGGMYAGVTLKENTAEINTRLIDTLKEQYEEDSKKGLLGRYVLISPTSKDPVLKETWRLIPEETKAYANKVFGKTGIYVRNDLLNVAFGYRKWTIADLWNPNSEYPKLIKTLAYKMVEGTYGKKVAHYLVKGERGLMELVKEIKDIVIIKSVVVMIANMVSNTFQLPLLHGVSPIAAVTEQITAFVSANEYRKNAKEIFELQTKIDAGLGSPEMERRITKLSQDQNRNPVKELMDAGMLQTIIDDAGMDDSIYSYKSSIANKLSGIASVIPEGVRETVKQFTIHQGSVAYDFLSTTTQLSDFAARYALYNHLKKQGMNTADAIAEITDAFINYDLPLHKGMQYLNDIGLTWFFKYYVRIQKVIVKGFLERPATILAFLFAQNYLGVNPDTPLQSFAPVVNVGYKTGLIDGISMGADAHIIARMF